VACFNGEEKQKCSSVEAMKMSRRLLAAEKRSQNEIQKTWLLVAACRKASCQSYEERRGTEAALSCKYLPQRSVAASSLSSYQVEKILKQASWPEIYISLQL